ncbi:uncharacterized protein LOC112554687 [Pomacea canaliculata]|uniref:uncharacterized protein LOC112554687 n=1 Tax=Pomacea canaliculata TaxID=400727 RepID=UPI000D7327AC|nr:uncharacterized protein LOC112554687 [Pomacea canaliculata]
MGDFINFSVLNSNLSVNFSDIRKSNFDVNTVLTVQATFGLLDTLIGSLANAFLLLVILTSGKLRNDMRNVLIANLGHRRLFGGRPMPAICCRHLLSAKLGPRLLLLPVPPVLERRSFQLHVSLGHYRHRRFAPRAHCAQFAADGGCDVGCDLDRVDEEATARA